MLTVPHARIDLPDGSSMSPDLGWAYSPGEAAFGTDVAVAKKLGTIQSLDTRAQFIQTLNNSPLRQAQFAKWTDEVLAVKPEQQEHQGLSQQALGFMTPSIQAAVKARLGREPSALLAIRARELTSHLTLQSTSNKSLSSGQYQQLPLMLAEPEAVLWDSENQHLLYVYPAVDGTEGNGSKDKVVINSAWQLTRQPNEGEVQLLTLSLAQLQQAQYQVLEGKLKG